MSNKIDLVRELCGEIRYLRKLCKENNIEFKREDNDYLEDEEAIINSFEFDSMAGTLLLLRNMSDYNSILTKGEKRTVEKRRKIKNILDVMTEVKVSLLYLTHFCELFSEDKVCANVYMLYTLRCVSKMNYQTKINDL